MFATYYKDLVLTAENDISSRNFCTLVDTAVSLFEEEERLRVGRLAEKGKAECEEESDDNDTRVSRLFPKKKRSFVSRTRNSPNPNLLLGEASTSSSSLLLDLNTIPSDCSHPQNPLCYTDKKNPLNPNFHSSSSVTEKASRKRRGVQETKPSGGSKKAKAGPVLSWRGRDTPDSILRIMRMMNVKEQEPKLIFEKPILYKTDVHPRQSRLSMPINQVIRNDFLNPEEVQILVQDINKKDKIGVDAFLVNELSQRWEVKLKRWESETSWSYVATGGWNDFVAANGLVEGKGVSVWTFRWCGLLCFAILPLPTQ